jgi:hypothetical protein
VVNWWGGAHLILSFLALIVGIVIAATLRSVGHVGADQLPALFLVVAGTWGMLGWLGLED